MYFKLRLSDYSYSIAKAVAAIPRGVTSLDLSQSGLVAFESGAKLAQAFKAIPLSVTSLDLSYNNLDRKMTAELVQIFEAIPEGVTSLNLAGNGLRFEFGTNGNGLVQVLKAIPQRVTSLNLSGNSLGNKNAPGLLQVLEAIPKGLTSLDLSWSGLDDETGARLVRAFRAIPRGVTSLNLSGNRLGNKTSEQLAQAFKALPIVVTSLDLSHNDLGEKTDYELLEVVKAIPRGVTSLNLAGNGLRFKVGTDQLGEVFRAIPRRVTSLDLSHNRLGNNTGAELARAFEELPKGLTSLDLSHNGLGEKTGAELVQIFAAIPRSVTSLNLSYDDLGEKTGAELAQVFAALPKGITVSFKGNQLFRDKTRAEKDALLIKLRQAANPNINLDLSVNGESDAQRAIMPLASLAKKPLLDKKRYIPQDVLVVVLSFLLPKETSFSCIKNMFSKTFDIVNLRPSINDRLMIGNASPLNFCNKYFDIHQESKDVLLIKDAKVISNEAGNLQQEEVRADKSSNEQDVSKKENLDWLRFNIVAMKEVQLGAIALGIVILLASSGVGMMALGSGLVTAGAAGLAMNFFSSCKARNATDLIEEEPILNNKNT